MDDPPEPPAAPLVAPPWRFAGIAWALFSSVCFSAMNALGKRSADLRIPLVDTLFWRAVIIFAVSYALLRAQDVPLRPRAVGWMLYRSVVGIGGTAAFFYALGEIPLAAVSTLHHTAPLFIAAFGGRLLGEGSSWSRTLWTLLAFLGVLLLVGGGDIHLDRGSFAAFASGFLSAQAYMMVRRMRDTDPPARIVFWFALWSVLTAGLATLWLHGLPRYSALQIATLLGLGLSAAGGQLAITYAYRLEKATVLAPFAYASVLFSFLLGLVFWNDRLSLTAALGTLLVVVSGVMVGRSAQAEEPASSREQPAR
ncbi:MAG: DMT family transporter [Polyangiaceae bacterium]|nr:DMT family transporter [Polyangiaceae bacterium]